MEYICEACGTEFPDSAAPPARCPTCEDPRQYVPVEGQRWTTLDHLAQGHRNRLQAFEPGLHGIITEPAFAIGQRAFLVRSPGGNVLWDCVSLLDEETARSLQALGGVSVIAISHPHYYTTMARWAERFDATIVLHTDDRQHVVKGSGRIHFFTGEQESVGDGLTVLRLGGHFAGSTVLHWSAGASGRGALLCGDTLAVGADRMLSFMYSYPNYIPLPAKTVETITERVLAKPFDRVYGAFRNREILSGGQDVLRRSRDRYLAALGGEFPA